MLLIAGCDNRITKSELEEHSASYANIPEYGTTPLPEFDQLIRHEKETGKNYDPSAIDWLKRYTDKNKKIKYAAVAGQWKPKKGKYKYQLRPLHFPDSIVDKADGEVIYYNYYLKDPETRTLRSLQAIIPATRKAGELMEQWLKTGDNIKNPNNSTRPFVQKKTTSEPIELNEQCESTPIEGSCWTWYPETGWTVSTCGEAVVCGGGSGGGGSGGSWPSDDGGDWGGDDSGGGGGSDGGDSDGSGGDGCANKAKMPVDGCEDDGENKSAPCDTNGAHPVLDDSNIQQAMNDTWNESYGTDDNPLPHHERNEAMFMVLVTSSGYEVVEIPAGPETSSCHFQGGTFNIPSNIAALIHTHPYSNGDTINDPKCGVGVYDGHTVSNADKSIVKQIRDKPILPPTPMYVIDKDNIRIIQPSNPSQYSETINRCGY